MHSIKEAYGSFHLRKASQLIMELASCGNVYFDAKKPWALAKDPSTHEAMCTVIGCCIGCLKALALVSSPIIPATAQKLWELIGFHTTLATLNWNQIMNDKIKPGTTFIEPKPLFKKIEDAIIMKEGRAPKKNSGKSPNTCSASKRRDLY